MNKEIRKINLAGYEEYGIDEDGDIYNFTTGKWLKKRLCGTCEYYLTTLYINGKCCSKTNHRLCAIAWHPLPDGSTEYDKWLVCHRDNNKLNINKDNLYWGTPQENSQQVYDDGNFNPRDINKYRRKHRTYIVYIDGVKKGEYHSYQEITDAFGIPHTTILRIVKSRTSYNKYKASIDVIEPDWSEE